MAPKPVRLVRKVGRPVKKNPVGRPAKKNLVGRPVKKNPVGRPVKKKLGRPIKATIRP
jgi:hypothetical protein